MTQVETTLRSAYLAGPMRGIPEYNFPEFRRAATWLRAQQWEIFSPAERDEADPAIDHTVDVAGWNGARGLDYFMAHDLKAVCEMDAVICLPKWEASQGARLETRVAVEIGHPVFVIARDSTGQRYLSHVHPDYIRDVFEEEGPLPPVMEAAVELEVAKPYDPLGCGHGPLERLEKIMGLNTTEAERKSSLPSTTAERKAIPLARGVLDYFPAALAEVAKVSKAGNDKHNPGQEMHHARAKSTDHADCLLRHLVDRGRVDVETGQRHSAEVAWRALALLQQELEDEGLAPLPRGAKL